MVKNTLQKNCSLYLLYHNTYWDRIFNMVDQQQVDNLKYKVSNVSESQLDDSKGKLQIKRINFMQDANHPDQTPGFTQIMLPETQQDDNGFFDME